MRGENFPFLRSCSRSHTPFVSHLPQGTGGEEISNTCRGTAGLANVGQLCKSGNVGVSNLGGGCGQTVSPELTWRTTVHEIGHSLGASDVISESGAFGIMDYGDGFFEGVTQFHPVNRPQICSVLTSASALPGDSCLRPIRINPHRYMPLCLMASPLACVLVCVGNSVRFFVGCVSGQLTVSRVRVSG